MPEYHGDVESRMKAVEMPIAGNGVVDSRMKASEMSMAGMLRMLDERLAPPVPAFDC